MVCIWERLTFVFNSLRCFPKDLGMVPSAPITIGAMKVFKLHHFLSSRFRSWWFSILLCWEISIWCFAGTAKSTIWGVFLLVLSIIIMSGFLCSIVLSVWMLKSQRNLKDSSSVQGLCSYHFLGLSFYNDPNAQSFPSSQSRRFYSFWRSLRHSQIMWVIVSSLALHIRHWRPYLVPSIFVLMLLVLVHWSWALAISDSVSLFKWPFCNQFHDLMSAISSVSLMNWPWNLLLFQSYFLFVCRLYLVISLLLLVLLIISMLQRWAFPGYLVHSGEALQLHPLCILFSGSHSF